MAILDLCLLVYCWLLHTIGDGVLHNDILLESYRSASERLLTSALAWMILISRLAPALHTNGLEPQIG
jgi:hypothetical protein